MTIFTKQAVEKKGDKLVLPLVENDQLEASAVSPNNYLFKMVDKIAYHVYVYNTLVDLEFNLLLCHLIYKYLIEC